MKMRKKKNYVRILCITGVITLMSVFAVSCGSKKEAESNISHENKGNLSIEQREEVKKDTEKSDSTEKIQNAENQTSALNSSATSTSMKEEKGGSTSVALNTPNQKDTWDSSDNTGVSEDSDDKEDNPQEEVKDSGSSTEPSISIGGDGYFPLIP